MKKKEKKYVSILKLERNQSSLLCRETTEPADDRWSLRKNWEA